MTSYPALGNFLSAYFHQDWQAEHGSAEAVVSYYLDSEADAEIVAVRDELAAVAGQGLDDAALATRLRGLGCEYDPTDDGTGWGEWLAILQRRFPAEFLRSPAPDRRGMTGGALPWGPRERSRLSS